MIVTDEQDAAIHRVIDAISVVDAWTEYDTSFEEFYKKYSNAVVRDYKKKKKIKQQNYEYYNQIGSDPKRQYHYYESKVRESCDEFHSEKTFDDAAKVMMTPIWALAMLSIQAIKRTEDAYLLLDKSVEEVEKMVIDGDNIAIMLLPVVKVLNRIKEGK